MSGISTVRLTDMKSAERKDGEREGNEGALWGRVGGVDGACRSESKKRT